MPNITLSVPEELYRKMKKRSDVKWSDVARRAILERLEALEGPVGYHATTEELREKIAKAGVKLEKIPIDEAVVHHRRMRELARKRISTIRAN